jgi:hypothetical protein
MGLGVVVIVVVEGAEKGVERWNILVYSEEEHVRVCVCVYVCLMVRVCEGERVWPTLRRMG